MSIKFADEIAKEIKERGQIQVPDGCVTGEEFEKWLREKNINITPKEIANDCQGILDMLNNDEEYIKSEFNLVKGDTNYDNYGKEKYVYCNQKR